MARSAHDLQHISFSKALGVDGWAGILRRLSKRIADSA